jgi:hypothetical protein
MAYVAQKNALQEPFATRSRLQYQNVNKFLIEVFLLCIFGFHSENEALTKEKPNAN